MEIAGRVFVVTGASSGIGRATARELARAGGKVVLAARRADKLDELATIVGAAAATAPVDVTLSEAPDLLHARAVEAFGRIDGLVNCAGRGLVGELLRLDVDLLDEAFELNLVAPLRLIQRIAPTLVAQGEGAIVNVISPTAGLGLPRIAGYAMTKSALAAMTVALRRELLASGVAVTAVYPGVTESEFYERVMGEGAEDEPTPPARPAQVVAAAIVRGIRRGEREVWALSRGERVRMGITRLFTRLAPGMLDRGLSRRER